MRFFAEWWLKLRASRPSGLAGVLNVHARSRRIFTERDVVLLAAIGSLFAGAVHQARLRRRLAAREHALERFAERVIEVGLRDPMRRPRPVA